MNTRISALIFLSIATVTTAAQSCCPGLTVIIGFFDKADVNAFVPPAGTLDPSSPTTLKNPAPASVSPIKSSPPTPLPASRAVASNPSPASAAPPSAEVGSVEEVVADAIARSVYHARRLADETCEAARSRVVPFANTNDKWQFQPVQMIDDTQFLYDMALFNNYWYYEDKSAVPFAKRVAVANVGTTRSSHSPVWHKMGNSPPSVCSEDFYGGLDLNNVANNSPIELIIRADPLVMSHWKNELARAVPCVETVCPKLHLVEATVDLVKDVQSVLPCCETTSTTPVAEIPPTSAGSSSTTTQRPEPTTHRPEPTTPRTEPTNPQSSNSSTLSMSVVPLLLMFYYSA